MGVPRPHLAAFNLLQGKEPALTHTSPHLSFLTHCHGCSLPTMAPSTHRFSGSAGKSSAPKAPSNGQPEGKEVNSGF